MNASFRLSHADLSPRPADVPARALTPVADAASTCRPEVVVRDAYVHWHDPDTVTVHPFKDTPLGANS